VPGDPDEVTALARKVRELAQNAWDQQRALAGIGSDAAQVWTGDAAGAFLGRLSNLPGELVTLVDSHFGAADAFGEYAPRLQDAQDTAVAALRQAHAAQTQIGAARAQLNTAQMGADHARAAYNQSVSDPLLASSPPPDVAVRQAMVLAGYRQSQAVLATAHAGLADAQAALTAAERLRDRAVDEANAAAGVLAGKLAAASRVSIANRDHSLFGPYAGTGSFAGSGTSDPPEFVWSTGVLPAGIADEDPLTPGENSQGHLGDCWLLSTINGMMESDKGRQQLRDGVRWDPAINGYQVRLYIWGMEVWMPVTRLAVNGAHLNRVPGLYGIATLYEAAMAQIEPNDVKNGGPPSEAASDVANKSTNVYLRLKFLFIDVKISDDAVKSGGSQVDGISVAGTRDCDTVVYDATPDPYSRTRCIPVTIVNNHDYEVVNIKNGMIGLRNPWGLGNHADGGACDPSGVFYISQADFDRAFTAETQVKYTGEF
jgi:hypothetical protein